MNPAIERKVDELVNSYGYDAVVLRAFAEFVLKSKSKKPSCSKKSLSMADLKMAVTKAFDCKDYKSLKKDKSFKLATQGRGFDFRKKEPWLILYREWVAVPEDERNETGPTCINGIDVLKNFRPWHVFELDPKTASKDDINSAFRRLAKTYHPDYGGDRRVFEVLQNMRDSILAFV